MKVRFTDSAEADLERIGDQIAVEDREKARLTIRAIRATARWIGALPKAASPVANSANVRKKSVRPYLILYTIRDDEAVVLRVAHERSDWTSLV